RQDPFLQGRKNHDIKLSSLACVKSRYNYSASDPAISGKERDGHVTANGGVHKLGDIFDIVQPCRIFQYLNKVKPLVELLEPIAQRSVWFRCFSKCLEQ